MSSYKLLNRRARVVTLELPEDLARWVHRERVKTGTSTRAWILQALMRQMLRARAIRKAKAK